MDLLLDREIDDLVFHNGPLTRECTTQPFVQTVAQRLYLLLTCFEGEWFIDINYGIPYWSWLGNKVAKGNIDRILQRKILAENGVKEIVYFNSTFVNRKYSLQFKVKVVTGEVTDLITVTPN